MRADDEDDRYKMFDLEIYEIVNILGLNYWSCFGQLLKKNQFCFSGSIKDYI